MMAEKKDEGNVRSLAKKKAANFIEQIQKLEVDKAVVSSEIKQVYERAKAEGFDTKAMKLAIKWLASDQYELESHLGAVDSYMRAAGLDGTPLGNWAQNMNMDSEFTGDAA